MDYRTLATVASYTADGVAGIIAALFRISGWVYEAAGRRPAAPITKARADGLGPFVFPFSAQALGDTLDRLVLWKRRRFVHVTFITHVQKTYQSGTILEDGRGGANAEHSQASTCPAIFPFPVGRKAITPQNFQFAGN